MDASCSSEKSIDFQLATWYYIQKIELHYLFIHKYRSNFNLFWEVPCIHTIITEQKECFTANMYNPVQLYLASLNGVLTN
jgi:hypothetical protein